MDPALALLLRLRLPRIISRVKRPGNVTVDNDLPAERTAGWAAPVIERRHRVFQTGNISGSQRLFFPSLS